MKGSSIGAAYRILHLYIYIILVRSISHTSLLVWRNACLFSTYRTSATSGKGRACPHTFPLSLHVS